MKEQSLPAEEFRDIDNIMLPDIRNEKFGENGLAKFRSYIEEFVLHNHVPEKLRIQFDTAKNLFLHAYYVYRFFPIVNHQLLVLTELAIRECVGENKLKEYGKIRQKTMPNGESIGNGLKRSMYFIVEHELVCNEDFPIWQHGKIQAAEDQYNEFVINKMDKENLDSYQWDEAEIDYENVEYDYDYLTVLLETTHKIRNSFAHGSTYLAPTAIQKFEITSVIINKIFERKNLLDSDV